MNSINLRNMNLPASIILCCVVTSFCGKVDAFKTLHPPSNLVTLSSSSICNAHNINSSPLLAYQQYKRRRKSALSATSTREGSTTMTKTLRQRRSEELFKERLTQLHEFRTEHGHGSIPTPYHPNPSLGIWAANLRQQNVLKQEAERKSIEYKGYLTDDRKRLLVKAGFDFTSLTERQFQTRLKELQEFKQQYGHAAVPEKYKENMALGAWVTNLRSLYRRKLLTQSNDETYEIFDEEQLKRRRTKNLIRQHRKVKRIRKHRFSHLNEERIRMLEDIGFIWKNHDKKWYEMLEWAKTYGVANFLLAQDPDSEMKDLIESRYNKIVRELQNPRLTSTFRSQEDIKCILLGEDVVQNADEQLSINPHIQQLNGTAVASESENLIDDMLHLDYRISPSDQLHQPLRIWMINQRSNYNRRVQIMKQSSSDDASSSSTTTTSLQSTMTDQRQRALEDINFPWSGRYRHRVEEIQNLEEKEAERIREMEKLAKREAREREEQQKVEMLTSSIVASIISEDEDGQSDDDEEEEMDIMSLWGAEDDDDDW